MNDSAAPKLMSTAFGARVPLRRRSTVTTLGHRTGFITREMNRSSNANAILRQDLDNFRRVRTNSNHRCRSQTHAAFTK